MGRDLLPAALALMQWGDGYLAGEEGPPIVLRHADCGAPVRVQLGCTEGHHVDDVRLVAPRPGPGARRTAGAQDS